jgi:hypothetical protein
MNQLTLIKQAVREGADPDGIYNLPEVVEIPYPNFQWVHIHQLAYNEVTDKLWARFGPKEWEEIDQAPGVIIDAVFRALIKSVA